jgi:hypothetical protein
LEKIKIKIITLGYMPFELNISKIQKIKSKTFEIIEKIENYSLEKNSDIEDWGYSDILILNELPEINNIDILFAITTVPLELNWYSRRLSNNKVVITLHDVKEILENNQIPIENLISYLLYAYTLAFKRYNNSIPKYDENFDLIHHETKGCLFDMHGIKTDLVKSCNKPIICPTCKEKLRNGKVSEERINEITNEIKKIKKPLFYTISDFIKKHPIWSLIISTTYIIIMGIISSIIATLLLQKIDFSNKPIFPVENKINVSNKENEILKRIKISSYEIAANEFDLTRQKIRIEMELHPEKKSERYLWEEKCIDLVNYSEPFYLEKKDYPDKFATEAIRACSNAVELNKDDVFFSFLLSLAYFKDRNYEKFISVIQDSASKGEPLAQRKIGIMYLTGNILPNNINKAKEWLLKAATNGDNAAKNIIDNNYFQ